MEASALPLRLTTVMVVDDEPFVRTLSRRMLEDAGYRVYEAGDGVDALALLAELGTVDAVITDLHMPNMDGFALAAYLASHYPRIPRLIISDFDQHPTMSRHLGHFSSNRLTRSNWWRACVRRYCAKPSVPRANGPHLPSRRRPLNPSGVTL